MHKKYTEHVPAYDYLLFMSIMLLLCIGLVFIYSASSNLAAYRFGDPYMYVKRQAFFCILGFILMLIAMHIPLNIYSDSRVIYGLLILSIIFLLSLFIIGHNVNGATRWIKLGPFSFQPSELAKFALCLYIAYSMTKKNSEMHTFKKGLLPHLIVVSLFCLLIIIQPDRGTALMIGTWLLIMLFVGGCSPIHIILLISISAPLIILYLSHSTYIIHRWKAFLNPWAYADTYGFQIVHSLYAFGTGGLFGVGLGASRQKLFYLPEPHTDFILAIIGEEMGFVGVIFVILLYAIIIAMGIKISIKTKNLFNKYLSFGITCMIALQVFINMAVVMNMIPAKGLTLPLLSYGGSSLLITMIELGILLNVSSKR